MNPKGNPQNLKRTAGPGRPKGRPNQATLIRAAAISLGRRELIKKGKLEGDISDDDAETAFLDSVIAKKDLALLYGKAMPKELQVDSNAPSWADLVMVPRIAKAG